MPISRWQIEPGRVLAVFNMIAISTLLEDIDDAVDKKEPPEKVRKLREEVARHRAELSELEGD